MWFVFFVVGKRGICVSHCDHFGMHHYHLCNASEQSYEKVDWKFNSAPEVFPQNAPQLAGQIDKSDKSEVFLKRHNLHPCSPFIHLPFIGALTTSTVPKHWEGSQVLIKRIRGTPDASITKGDLGNSGYFSRWAKPKKTCLFPVVFVLHSEI